MQYKYFLIKTMLLIFTSFHLNAADSLSIYMDFSEGGSSSTRNSNKLINFFKENNCNISSIAKNKKDSDFLFLPLDTNNNIFAKKILTANTISAENKDKISNSILINKSRGVTDISALSNSRIGLISRDSALTNQLLSNLIDNKVKLDSNKLIQSNTNVSLISFLLHGDIFAAIIATPLADKWKEQNQLMIITTSKSMPTGGIYINKNINKNITIFNNCINSFKKINTKTKLKSFPLWLDGFINETKQNNTSTLNNNKAETKPELEGINYVLPPHPGEAGKKTLAGIDVNNNGVRDDVEIAIYEKYPDNPVVRRALWQDAIAATKVLLAGDSQIKSELLEAAIEETKAVYCTKNTVREKVKSKQLVSTNPWMEPSNATKFVEIMMVNTDARAKAYMAYNQSFSGGILPRYKGDTPCDWK